MPQPDRKIKTKMPKAGGGAGFPATEPPEIHSHLHFSMRQIPTIGYTLQNMAMSLAAVAASAASFFVTTFFFLPLAVVRTVLARFPGGMLMGNRHAMTDVNKVILIVGASRGIGFNVLKQYADDPNAVIVAASRSVDSLRKAVIELGDTRATIQCAEIDLTASPKQLAQAIRVLDKQYGPFTHLFEVSGISNHLKDSQPWGLDVTTDMINVNVTGTVAAVITMYELMKERRYGKICVVGSVAGLYGPANMISYASTKAFINTFTTSLRVLALTASSTSSSSGVEVVTVQPGFIDTRMTKQMRNASQQSTVTKSEFASAEGMAKEMKKAVERGGVGVVSWPVRQSVIMYGLKSVNPICDEFGRWASMKLGMAGRKIT
ncbi:hypothetical protein D9619_003938 [Psilocybe cf. subviscida]|uniref:NAD(P)-binding protein n=1 Tax=Psilocybe cf. subviscida TaxID=2480587 RepID=A0A8H5F838_9AGAR|nr:hypothetical protein D9619_003938 [Psilocybe cf. subviscida]